MRLFVNERIPMWLKVAYTAFIAVLVPYYWVTYGPANFLYFCDVALLLTLVALWTENRFLASMQLVAIGLPQLLWIVEFLLQLCGGPPLTGLASYMFAPGIPFWVRGLSSFHGWLPILLIWTVWRFGYDRRAFPAQIALGTVLLLVCYFFTAPPPAPAENLNAAVNVNWVFGLNDEAPQTYMPPLAWLALLIVGFPVCFYLPAHLILRKVIPNRADRSGGQREEAEEAEGQEG
jgi:hypothetical protein